MVKYPILIKICIKDKPQMFFKLKLKKKKEKKSVVEYLRIDILIPRKIAKCSSCKRQRCNKIIKDLGFIFSFFILNL